MFSLRGAIWSQDSYLKASNTDQADLFGSSLALSADGSMLAVGAPGERSDGSNQADNSSSDAGAVYLFIRNESTWSQQSYLKASNANANDWFGRSVALSSDGNTLVVGADQEDGDGTRQGDNSAVGAGAVYVFSRSAMAWTQEAYLKASNADGLDRFGQSIALSDNGNTLAVAAPYEGDLGAVYVFTRSATTWSQEAYIKAGNAEMSDSFGSSITMSGDGNTIAVGAPWKNTGTGDEDANPVTSAGAVYVFFRSGVDWSQQAYVKAGNSITLQRFGSSVSLSRGGTVLAVGALGGALGAGAVHMFYRRNMAWGDEAYLVAISGSEGDSFGSEVVLGDDGNTLAVGALLEDSNARGLNGEATSHPLLNFR